MTMKRAGHQTDPRRDADGPLVPKGEGYQEIIATRTMRKRDARKFIYGRQRSERRHMRKRASEIEAGLIHETPAMESRAKLEGSQ